ncbi:DUF1592 domain-containing protein [Lignipirellula cremea]|uniref:Planctomycete cytochrome C n=1 Tax=Lignipirellula cremea TaxID=2528010 RepID=A0A518DM33_9BACT|nr:DUF1592 domain-containing protein [Lignipirellula cremea]QDU92900.1 Planctomycete cytochrome C [Lignipirellula cremea]
MVRFFTCLGMLAVLCLSLSGADRLAQGAAPLAVLRTHCIDCHGPDTQEGHFRVDTLPEKITTAEAVARWSRVVARLEAGEMPPPDNPRPAPAQVQELVTAARTGLAEEAQARRQSGRAPLRRLNRLEYENTLHDLLGIVTPLQDLLPADDLADGFSNGASALSISPVHIQQYMTAADTALQAAIARQPRPETATHRFSYCDEQEKPFYGHGSNEPFIRTRGDDLWFFRQTHIEVPAYLRQFARLTQQNPGSYRIRVTASTRDTDGQGMAYSVWTAAGGKRRELIGYYDAKESQPGTIEIVHAFEPNETIIVAPYRINQARIDAGFSVYSPQLDLPKDWQKDGNTYEPHGPSLVVAPVEITGPLHPVWPPQGHVRLFGETPLVPVQKVPAPWRVPPELQRPYRGSQYLKDAVTPVADDPQNDARRLLKAFLPRAFRRPTTDADLQPYLAIAESHLERQDCFEVAMLAAYRAVLCSPDFLFLVEEPGPLDDHALACRLSYFLWRSPPDDALRAAADAGQLHQPQVLRRETERLLDSPRSDAMVDDFLDHWLKLREINATMPDKVLFPEYYEDLGNGTIDGLLHQSVVAETRAYFADLVQRDGSLLELIDSDYAFLNVRLAQHYDLPPVAGVQLRRVKLPAGSQRGGVLTQASVLKVTANGTNTSPVVRGAWILENIVGQPAPPPPADIGAIEPDTRGASTIREQLAKHKNSSSCAGCHRKIDPPGFALEAFDPIGLSREFYRTTETGDKVASKFFAGSGYRPVKFLHGQPVDPSGQMADGEAFAAPGEFKQLQLREPAAITRCLAGKLIAFGTGQHPEPGDLLALEQIVDNTQRQKYGLRSLLHQIINSPLFLNK